MRTLTDEQCEGLLKQFHLDHLEDKPQLYALIRRVFLGGIDQDVMALKWK